MMFDTEPEEQTQPAPAGTDPALDEVMKTLEKDPEKMLGDIPGVKKEEQK
ncbi:hypothetical protein K2P56_02755 [Patescibacteria group bacterium]|nr:hypothetical protein [Patescibacteria group bacterium]